MKDRILKIIRLENFDVFVEGMVFLFAGFVFSFSKISGIFSPFCLAFCFSLGRNRSFFAFCGGLVGTLFGLTSENLVYFFALIFGFILKFIFNGNSNFSNSVCTMIALAVPKLFSMILVPVSFATWIVDYCEVVLSAVVAFLFSKTLKKKFKNSIVNFYDFIGLFFILIAVLIAFCSFNLFGFNFGKTMAVFLIVESLVLVGIGGCTVMGAFVTVGLILFTKNFADFGVVALISGFLTGVFNSLSKSAKVITYNGVFFLCSIFWGGLQYDSLFEVFAASVLVLLFPSDILNNFFSTNKIEKLKSRFKINDELSFKLKFTASTLLDLQSSIEKCAKSFDAIMSKNMKDVYAQVVNDVCRGCGLNTFCWVTSYNEITRCFNDMSERLRENGRVEADKLPIFLKQKCCKQKQLLSSLNFEYKDFICKEQTSRRINEARAIAAEQFTGMAELLSEMSCEILDVEKIDDEACQAVTQIFKDELIEVEGVFCFFDKFERLIIDVYLNSLPSKSELKKIAELIGAATDREIEFPSIIEAKTKYRISFFEAATLKVDFAAKQTTSDGGSCCGDSYDYFMDGKGFAHMLLSDGMGNGKRAAVDSLMTCFTIRKLIETGFGFNSTLKLLNLSFSIKSKEESLATVDTCTIDLYSGCVKFFKAGATASFLSINGEIVDFVSTSLPIGIIQGITFDSKEFQLKKGDAIVMVSDGATSSGFDWIAIELKTLLNKPAKRIASTLLEMAQSRCDVKHKDDITVLVAKIF